MIVMIAPLMTATPQPDVLIPLLIAMIAMHVLLTTAVPRADALIPLWIVMTMMPAPMIPVIKI